MTAHWKSRFSFEFSQFLSVVKFLFVCLCCFSLLFLPNKNELADSALDFSETESFEARGAGTVPRWAGGAAPESHSLGAPSWEAPRSCGLLPVFCKPGPPCH